MGVHDVRDLVAFQLCEKLMVAVEAATATGPAASRVAIADDHPLFREAARKLLELDPSLQVVGEAGSGREGSETDRACHGAVS